MDLENENGSLVWQGFQGLEEIPGMEALTLKLKERVCPTGESVATFKAFRTVQEQLKHSQLKYLTSKVTYNELEQMILDYDIDMLYHPQSTEESLAISQLRDRLSAGELANMVPLDPDVNLMGVSIEELTPRNNISESIPFLEAKLEKRLMQRCMNLIGVLDKEAIGSATLNNDVYTRANQLPEMVKTEIENVEAHKQRAVGMELLAAQRKQFEMLNNNLDVLERLAVQHKMGSRSESDTTRVKYLGAKCKTLVLKIKCLEHEILCSTYTPESVQALKKIRKHLDSSIAETKAEIDRVRNHLKQYETVGPTFDAIVADFAKVQGEIEGKRWALRELKKN